jgi:hypothetical protein
LCKLFIKNKGLYEIILRLKGWEDSNLTIPSTHFKIADAKREDIGYLLNMQKHFEPCHLMHNRCTLHGRRQTNSFLEYENRIIPPWIELRKLAKDFEKAVGCYMKNNIAEDGLFLRKK